ncbi:hypothetical protein V1264_000560 [Littorina saxatilis]|uniref:Cyclic nucleotide-binding domain-containing protein n=2 Tax=Littorina saxatilis TaxID=31220 RepID=A0AAN9C4Y5_9CAEN
MADAGFDIVEADTHVDDMFQNFSQRHLSVSKIFKKMTRNSVTPAADISEMSEDQKDEAREDKLEAIYLLLKAQKKTYWRHFERGLMSKEALHQLIDWADSAADHRGKFLDVRKVKEASQVRPILKSLKRQVKIKLRQLHHEALACRGWQYWQQQVLPMILSYGFHVIDTLMVLLAVVLEFVDIPETNLDLNAFLMFWNGSVVGIYGMIALGELLVMRLRFFKIVWHNITMVIVLVGLLDILVMASLGQTKKNVAHVFTRVLFVLSRLVRLLGLVEIIPWILEKFFKLLEQRISGQLGVGFDICCAYVTGQVEVSRWLEALVQDPAIVIELKRHCNKSKLEIIKTLGILALENPTIALSVKTRQAMRIVLNAEHDTVEELRSEGALQDSDAALLTKDLEERMKKLLTAPPLVDDDSEDSIIRNVGWVQGDEDLFHYIKDHMEIWSLKANTIITEQGQDDYSIYIIKSGVARLERATDKYFVSVMDYMTAGNVVGEINFLTKAIRFKTVRCETPVTVLALTEETLELALARSWSSKLPPLLYRMWLVIAKRVAIKVFMDDPDFQALSNDFIRMHLFDAYLVDNLHGNSLNIHNDPRDDVILIHGYARDAFTRQPFRGPSYIPRTCFQLQLLPEEGLYPLVLIVPVEPLEMDEYEIHPTRRGSNIDHDVLASGSIEALKLEELFRATHQTEDHGPISPQSTMDRRQFMQTGNGYSSESSSDDLSCVSTTTYTHIIPEMQNEQEIIVQPPHNPVNPKKEKHEKHLPFGTWDLSDTWEDASEYSKEDSKSPMGRASTSIDSFDAHRH